MYYTLIKYMQLHCHKEMDNPKQVSLDATVKMHNNIIAFSVVMTLNFAL